MNLKEFRDLFPAIKPGELMKDGLHTYEVISWPWEEDNKYYVNVRTTPGDSNTLKTIEIHRYHPKVAKLIDQGIISLTNAMIMAKLPIDDQPRFIASATFCNTQFFETLVKGHLSEKEKFNKIDENIKDLKDCGKTLKELYPPKNILFVIKGNISYWALIPSSKLDKLIDLDEMNGVSLNDKTIPIRVRIDILVLLKRLGIINDDIDPDLKKYLNPCPPFHVDDICHISL